MGEDYTIIINIPWLHDISCTHNYRSLTLPYSLWKAKRTCDDLWIENMLRALSKGSLCLIIQTNLQIKCKRRSAAWFPVRNGYTQCTQILLQVQRCIRSYNLSDEVSCITAQGVELPFWCQNPNHLYKDVAIIWNQLESLRFCSLIALYLR